MYSSLRDRPLSPETPSGPDVPVEGGGVEGGGVDGNVVALGATSFFTDISSEMVNAVLPLYLMVHLGFSPLAFGLFDGVYQGMTGLLRIGGGIWADRAGRFKEVAGLGYALSALSKIGLLVARTTVPVTAVLLADRTGKGLRTAPRDALISLSSRPERLAESFGVHRALDTAGAIAGPVLAFFLLARTPDGYDTVFVTSFFVAVIGLGVLACFVRNRAPSKVGAGRKPSWSAAAGLLGARPFRRLVVAGGLLGVVTVSDAFIYATLSRRSDMATSAFPLLFVGTAVAYLVLAVPLGRLADRIGRVPVFLGGHVLLAGAYVVLRQAGPGRGSAFAVLGLLGAYYAATDGVLMALASSIVPERLRTSGLALLTTVTAATRFGASLLFALAWTWGGPDLGVSIFLVALLIALPVAFVLLAGSGAPAAPPPGSSALESR